MLYKEADPKARLIDLKLHGLGWTGILLGEKPLRELLKSSIEE